MVLSALRYAGGKAGKHSAGRWIAAQLPATELYVEPFCGMLGVLLQRPKAAVEIVNDTNRRLINWWRCLRDEPDELLRLMAFSPHSRDEFVDALSRLDDVGLTSVERAAAYGVVLRQSYTSSDTATAGDWLVRWTSGHAQRRLLMGRLGLVADRISDLQVENVDAVTLLERTAGYRQAVVYCDPPYYSVGTDKYAGGVDLADLTEVLKAQTGRVAISGYGSEWDCLGWRRLDTSALCHTGQPGVEQADITRREVLWCNYPAAQPGLF